MGFSLKPTSRKDLRSITLPCRSHPSTYRIEKLLNKVKTWESISSLSNPSAEYICTGVCQLTKLYECFDDLLKTCLSTSRISSNQNMKWTDELLDVSVSFLDMLSNTSDVLVQTKQQVRDLGCDLRRKGGPSIECIIANYILFRTKLRKDIKRCVVSLIELDNMIYDCPFMMADIENHLLTSVIRVFRQVTASTTFILRLLLKFLATPVFETRPASRWTVLSRYISKGKVVPEEKADTDINELQRLDAALFGYNKSYKLEFLRMVQKKREEFEATVDSINTHLESMSRHLISPRSCLLNLVSFN